MHCDGHNASRTVAHLPIGFPGHVREDVRSNATENNLNLDLLKFVRATFSILALIKTFSKKLKILKFVHFGMALRGTVHNTFSDKHLYDTTQTL